MPYEIRMGAENMRLDDVMKLLSQAYWANTRTRETVKKSLENSLCCGAFDVESGEQVSLARAVTDGATMYYLCDVVVDEKHRGQGLSKLMLDALLSDERLKNTYGLLLTSTAPWLYEKYGFKHIDRAMRCEAQKKEE